MADLLAAAFSECGSTAGDDDAPLIGSPTKKHRKDESFQMQLITARLVISLASSMRAAESAVYYTWHGDMGNPVAMTVQRQGQSHDQKVKKAISSGGKYNLTTPMHVVQWLSAVDNLLEIYTDVGSSKAHQAAALLKYKTFSRANLARICEEVRYFMGIICYDKKHVRIITRIEPFVPSPTSAALEPMEHQSATVFAMMRDYFKDND